MARSEKRRQQKLASRRKKRDERKRELARRKSVGNSIPASSATWSVIASRISDCTSGLQTALIARKADDGRIVAVNFLVDTYCLGVKDLLVLVGRSAEWNRLKEQVAEGPPMRNVPPEHLCKFVLDAVAFAQSFGLSPHRDYSKAVNIFSGLDPNKCETEFTFGINGKPTYVAGPFDSEARSQRIMQALASAGIEDSNDIARVDNPAAALAPEDGGPLAMELLDETEPINDDVIW